MNKKLASIVAGGFTALMSVAAVSPLFTYSEFNENGTYVITDADKSVLIGIDNPDDYFLGIASQFSVFVQGDFTAEGSDCEGRLAAGGNANLGSSTPSYSVGAKLDPNTSVAQVVIGGTKLQHFEPNGKNFVASFGADVENIIMDYMSNGLCKVYNGELFNFDEQFALLRERSSYLAGLSENAELEINEYYKQEWTVTGDDKNLNVINLSPEEYAIFANNEKYIELNVKIPEGSYLVINIPGSEIQLPLTTVKVDYTDDNSDEKFMGENLPVLYNLPDAVEFKYNGSIQGSTLAPNADASGDEGGHVAGMTIAKSFEGGIQFGYSTFNPSISKMVFPDDDSKTTTTTTTTTTTKATTTTTTTTKATTTTTKATTTTTTKATTTTTKATSVSSTSSTSSVSSSSSTTVYGVLPDGDSRTTSSTSAETVSGTSTETTNSTNSTDSTNSTNSTDSTSSTGSTGSTSSTDSNTSTSTTSKSSDTSTPTSSPKTGDVGVASLIVLMSTAVGIAFVSSKKKND